MGQRKKPLFARYKTFNINILTLPPLSACPWPWISNVICCDIFSVLWVQWGWEVIVRFIVIDGIDHHRWLNFLVTIWVWNCFCFSIRFWNCSNNVGFFGCFSCYFNHIPKPFQCYMITKFGKTISPGVRFCFRFIFSNFRC